MNFCHFSKGYIFQTSQHEWSLLIKGKIHRENEVFSTEERGKNETGGKLSFHLQLKNWEARLEIQIAYAKIIGYDRLLSN